jgi:hypothetical protein
MADKFGFKPAAGLAFGYELADVSGGEAFGFERVEETPLFSVEGAKSIAKGVLPNIKMGIQGLELLRMEHPGEDLVNRPIVQIPGSPREVTASPETIAAQQKKLQKTQAEIEEITPAKPSYPLKIVGSGLQSALQNAPAIAASIATRNPAPAIASALTTPQYSAYARDRTPNEKGKTRADPDTARVNAAIHGAIEGGLEMIPMGGLIKDIGKQSLGKTAGKYLLREEATEIPTTILQNLSDQALITPEKPLGQFAKETASDVLDTALSTPFAAGGTLALATPQQRLQDAYVARREAKKLRDLEQYKADAIADLQQGLEAAQAGIPKEELTPAATNPPPVTTPVEDAPLTEEQEKLLALKLQQDKTGANAIPPDPVAVADAADIDALLSDPVYKQPEDFENEVESQIQNDMDRGMSREVAERRARETHPNQLKPMERPIVWSTDPAQQGMTLGQTKVAPDGVVLLGGNEDQFSPAYVQALGETIAAWSKKWMPTGSRILLNLGGLKGEAVGGYQQSASGIHIITPRELVRSERAENQTPEGVMLGRLPGTGYNSFTQQQTFGALTHEFGHAVVMASFAQNMPEQHKNVIAALDNGQVYSPEELAQMPAPEAAVIQDYQQMKAAVLSGKMSAEQLVERWLGTWKLGKDLMKQTGRTLYSHAVEVLKREAKLTGDMRLANLPLNQIPARTLIHAMGRNKNVPAEQSNAEAEAYYLQFNEYMAEQFSRYAHANKIDEGTPLGVYFKKALQSLREFFKMLKTTKGTSGERIIKPGVSFQQWIDGLPEAKALRMAKKEETVKKTAKKKAPAKKKEKAEAKPKEESVEKLPKKVAEAVREEEQEAGEGNAITTLEMLAEDPLAKELLREKIRQAIPDPKDRFRSELMGLVATGQLLDALDQLTDYINMKANKPKLDVDPSLEEVLEKIGERKQATLWQRAMNFVRDRSHALLQLQQISHTVDDQGVWAFVEYQNRLMAMKNQLLKAGTDVAKAWENLSRRDTEALEKVLLDEWHSGGHMTLLEQDPVTKKWSHKAGAAFELYLKNRGVDTKTPEGQKIAQLILDVKNSILEHIDAVERVSLNIADERYRNNDLAKQKRRFHVRQIADKWRKSPFVPQSHYGNFVVKVFEKNDEGERVLAWKGHFESAAEQDAAVKRLQKHVHPNNLRWMKIDDTVGPQLIMPKDFLESLAETGEFSSEQIEAIGDAMMPLRPERGFSKLERESSRIAGASPDILRNYANWIEDSANFVSKLEYSRRMTKSRAWTRTDMNELRRQGKVEEAREKQRLLDTMTKAQQFIMHPMEEWYQTRSVIALTYLMYAPKTALMNATGLFQSWAAMTADYGELRGNALMAGSIKDLMSGKLTADEHKMKDQALKDGIIDQGFGYFMSGLANAGNLSRRIRPTMAGKAARLFVDTGMYLFKAVETGNRNLTMLSIYRAERQRFLGHGDSIEEATRKAYEAAARKTRLLQNDYASGNRPEILRGRKSLFMIFLSYPQYMLWIMSGGYERGTRQEAVRRGETPRSALGGMTMRMWLIFLAMSGTEGVPFGEAIVDLLQRMWSKFGTGDNIRVEAHRFLKDTMGIESMYWRKVIQRGFLHDVLGADLSGSYSLGKPLPGLGLIDSHADNWREFVGETFEEFAGPFGGVVKSGIGLGMSDEVGAKELGQNLPGTAGSIARAVNAADTGLKSSRGERILRDEKGNLREPTTVELVAIGAGFRLAEAARFQELEALKKQQTDYWNGRRLGLKKSYQKAIEDRDPAVREDVLKAVAEYNAEIPHRALKLTGKELREYVRGRTKAVRRLEQDRDPRRIRALNRDISQVMGER